MKDAVIQAIRDYIERYASEKVSFNVEIIKENRKNLLSFIVENEIKSLLSAIIEAQKRRAPTEYINELKREVLTLLKKHPVLSEETADEVKTVFRNLADMRR